MTVTHERQRLPVRGDHDPCRSVDRRGPCERGQPAEGERLRGHGVRPGEDDRVAGLRASAVGPQDDIGVQHRDEPSKLPSRAVAKKASTISRRRVRSGSGTGARPCTRRRARLASRRHRAGGNLSLEGADTGTRTWEDFLAARVGRP
ncbi:hypothetical protein [Streptomyces sp. NBC_00887]|uniref:hypothetical protein n=1 Tax=Streptomyces sp. NBC_00887 TaxID=2975859 RepID=UPI00386B3F92